MQHSKESRKIWIHIDREVSIHNKDGVFHLPLNYKWAKTLAFSLVTPNRNRLHIARAVVDQREEKHFLDTFRTNYLQPLQRQLRKRPWSMLGELLTDKATNEMSLANAMSNIDIIWQLAEQGKYSSISQYLGQLPEKLSFFHGFKEVKQKFLTVASKAMHTITMPLIQNKDYCETTANQLEGLIQAYPFHAQLTELYLKLLLIHHDFERCEEVCQHYFATVEKPAETITIIYKSLDSLKKQSTKHFLDGFNS